MAFHAYLNDEDDAPYEWVISRICEEYGCLPSQAVEELENDPDRLCLRIMPLREFYHTKLAWDRAKKKSDLPRTDMLDTFLDIEFGFVEEEIKENDD